MIKNISMLGLVDKVVDTNLKAMGEALFHFAYQAAKVLIFIYIVLWIKQKIVGSEEEPKKPCDAKIQSTKKNQAHPDKPQKDMTLA